MPWSTYAFGIERQPVLLACGSLKNDRTPAL